MKTNKLIIRFLIFAILITCIFTGVQAAEIIAPNIEWQKCYGGSGNDKAKSIQLTSDGGYIIAGYTTSNDGDVSGNHGGIDYWVVKLDDKENIQWQKCYGGSGNDYAESIFQTSDGGYIVTGTTKSNDGDVSGYHGMGDYWVVKLDDKGDIQWQKCLGGSDVECAYSVIQTSDGGFIVAGQGSSDDGDVGGSNGVDDVWIVKLDDKGNTQWQKCYGGSDIDWATSISQTSDEGYIITGNTFENLDLRGGDGWLIKIDSSGSLQWQKIIGGSKQEITYSVKQTSDGGYIVAGMSTSNDRDMGGIPGGDYLVVKLDDKGNIQWQKLIGGSGSDSADSILQTSDGGYIVVGTSSSNDGDVSISHDGRNWVVKLDDKGNIQWQKSIGGSGEEIYDDMIQNTPDGGYIVAGHISCSDEDVSGGHGDEDFWLVKIKSDNVNEKIISDYTITWDNPVIHPGDKFIGYTFEIHYNKEDDPEDVTILIEPDFHANLIGGDIWIETPNGKREYPASTYFKDDKVGKTIRETRNKLHLGENQFLIGTFDKLLYKNIDEDNFVKGMIFVDINSDAQAGEVIENKITIKDKNQLVNTFYGGIGFDPTEESSIADRMRDAFLLDATLRYSYGIDPHTGGFVGDNWEDFIDDTFGDVKSAADGHGTDDNYLNTKEGDGTNYNIAFSHSGGTQTLYQKIIQNKVKAKYAVFISPALIYQSGMPEILSTVGGVVGFTTGNPLLEQILRLRVKYSNDNLFQKLFDHGVEKVVIVWSDKDVLNKLSILQNDKYESENNVIVIYESDFPSDFNSIDVHKDLLKKTIYKYQSGYEPFDNIQGMQKQVLPEDQQGMSTTVVEGNGIFDFIFGIFGIGG